jgi:hypothetical protein
VGIALSKCAHERQKHQHDGSEHSNRGTDANQLKRIEEAYARGYAPK